jgi:choline dehydrogenase-like flavoprotein
MDTLDGMEKLGQCLFEAGAQEIYPSVLGSRAINNMAELKKFKTELASSSPGRLNMMTIHLLASCPMGEDKSLCVVDSFGKVHGQDNLYVNDASMLCDALGVNPQGTIMAIARRNVAHFLEKL